nr:RNA-directed DNA polymerase, eukaryota [Tanacetum cinerariifolium]
KKRRQLAIRGILKDGNWIEDPSIVKSKFLGHFMARFQQSEGIIPVLDSNYISPISHVQRDLLERPFSRDEIKLAVWDCGGDKALGPDGFSFKFFTFFWDLIENDVRGGSCRGVGRVVTRMAVAWWGRGCGGVDDGGGC